MFSNMMCDQFNWPGYRLYLLLLGQHAGPKMINLLSGHPMSRSDSNVNISLAKFKMPTIIYKPSEMFCIVVVRANCRHQLLPHFQYRGQTKYIQGFFFKSRRFLNSGRKWILFPNIYPKFKFKMAEVLRVVHPSPPSVLPHLKTGMDGDGLGLTCNSILVTI